MEVTPLLLPNVYKLCGQYKGALGAVAGFGAVAARSAPMPGLHPGRLLHKARPHLRSNLG